MERNNNNNWSNNLKDHGLGKSCYYYSNNKKVLKSPWEYSGTSSSRSSNPNGSYNGDHHQDYGKYNMGQQGLFSWPPRSYTCSFCKREFRSAQALGGHMNVHRRDRARLRVHEIESSPNSSTHQREDFNLNLTPSPPNPNFLTTPPPLSSLASADCSKLRPKAAVKSLFGECDVRMTMKARDHDRVLGLDLGIGLFRGDHRFKEDLDLDLELRLGW